MPDAPDAGGGGGQERFGFLARKLGPLPVWVWGLLIVGGYYLYTKYKSGSASSTQAATDPATGQTYAQELQDAEDQISSLQSQVNAQGQGPAGVETETINVNVDEDQPGSGTPKPPKPAKVGAVTDLVVSDEGPGVVSISWRPPQFPGHKPNATTYKIQVAPKDRTPHEIGSRTAYNVSGLKNGQRYTVTVTPSQGEPASKAFTAGGQAKGHKPGDVTVSPGFNPGGPVQGLEPQPPTTRPKNTRTVSKSAAPRTPIPVTLKTPPRVNRQAPAPHAAPRRAA